MLKRADDRTWLDLDPLYPPGLELPNTVFKSMAIAFRAMGADVDYVDLMGLSAAAFRIQVGAGLCPSSPHPSLGFRCDALARETLPFELEEHPWDPRSPETVAAARQAVVASVDRGVPALAMEEETGLAVGYVGGGEEILVRHPYSRQGEGVEKLIEDHAWTFGVVVRPPDRPSRKALLRSLEAAVELAHTGRFSAYASGFGAYDEWIATLSAEDLLERSGTEPGAVLAGNAHIYYCLVDARRCASAYLRRIAPELPEAAGSLEEAATRYQKIADRIEAGFEHVPWPRQLASLADWGLDRRRLQAERLAEVRDGERAAVGALEAAIGAVSSR